MILIDDFTRMMWVAIQRDKPKAFEKFKLFKNRVENEFGLKIKCLRSNRGGEFISNEFNNFCEDNGIKRQLTVPKTLQQNGIVEKRKISMIKEATTSFCD